GHRGNLRVDRREGLPAFLGASRHDGRALKRAFFATAHSDTEKVDAFLLEGLLTPLSIGPKRIPSIDDDVSRLKEWHKLVDHSVHGCSGLDHDLGLTGPRKGLHKFFKGLGRQYILALGASRGELFGYSSGSIEHADTEASA